MGMLPKGDMAQEALSETPEDKFKAIHSKILAAFIPTLDSLEVKYSDPAGLEIDLGIHHQKAIGDSLHKYLDELESAYLKGEY